MNKCAECDWFDSDPTFFYERDGELYCSLHKERGKRMRIVTIVCDKCGWQENNEEYFFEYEGQLLCSPDYHNTEEGKARLCRIGK